MRDDRGERKKYKIINRRATVTVHMHSYCSICHKCTFLPLLMWVFFCSKCVKWATFSILQDFIHIDANTLSLVFCTFLCEYIFTHNKRETERGNLLLIVKLINYLIGIWILKIHAYYLLLLLLFYFLFKSEFLYMLNIRIQIF